MTIKNNLFDKISVFKRKIGIFLYDLELTLLKIKDWFNKQINSVLDTITLLKDIIGLKIENYRINRIIKLERRIGNIKGKIKYQ